ncbi:MAG: DedA family protein [Magnetococcales bacterium]|nr:DedA family protein [Magnetococcales bacterium]
MLRRLYDWTMKWAASPQALPALFIIAMAESSFFPIPPDLLLIPMVLAVPAKGLVYAAWCTVGSVIGGALGYLIGYQFWQWIGEPIIEFYGAAEKYAHLSELFNQYDAWIVGIAAFSPIPYKLFTITAGAMHSDFGVFILTSLLARGARFFLVAGLLKWGGDRLRNLVEEHLNLLVTVLTVMVILGFVVIKYLL